MSSAADIKTTLTWVLKDEVSGPAKGMGASLGGLVNPTTLAIGAVAGLTAGIGSMIGSAMEAQKITAQTAAVLKSTGSAAGLTAKQIQDLATRISEYSGIDDGAVQAGENLLLTFTNIKDEVGEGNDIFTQATEIMADMATAMGTDMSSQAIQLGKALNDPIAGIGALSRVGVTFTEEQKNMIKAMVEAGDVAGAQAVIMAELTKEFGGSAQAAGDTAAGGFLKLQNKIGEMGEAIGTELLPFIEDLTDFLLIDLVPAVEDLVAQLGLQLSAAFDSAAAGFKVIGDAVGPLVAELDRLSGHATTLLDILNAIGGALNPMSGLQNLVTPGGGFVPNLPTAPYRAPNLPSGGGRTAPARSRVPRAAGGPVDPYGSYLVGEQGPEWLQMGSQGGSIIPGGGSGSPVEIPIIMDGREVARLVDERLYLKLQRSSPSAGRA